MEKPPHIPNSDESGELQRFVDALFLGTQVLDSLDVQVKAELYDLGPELMEVVSMLPPGHYERTRLADQLNSVLAAHGWAGLLGTVE